MSSMSSVAGLSKYIKTLPKTKYSIMGILIISFIIGTAYFVVEYDVDLGLIDNILYGGLFGLFVLGFPSALSGVLNQKLIKTLNGINVKIKHSMFLSGLSLIFLGFTIVDTRSLSNSLVVNTASISW